MRPQPAPTRWSAFAPRREFAWRQDVPALLALFALAAYFVAASWRKWPDPLIDFGRELYTPWRLSQGAELYRDVDAIYGPLSQYANAALFRAFGPGLMVLVTANLLIFAAIVVLLYGLLRRAFGLAAALVAMGVFISVFGFSQLVVVGNYNFAAPYAHEVTHGFLACLLLVSVLVRWVERSSPGRSFLAGVLLGVTAVLKPEFMLAAGLVTLAAVLLRWRAAGAPGRRCVAAWLAGALLPTLLFTGWFLRDLPAADALAAACRAWLNVVASSSFTGDVIQAQFLGLDRPWTLLRENLQATGIALALMAVIAGGAWLSRRRGGGVARHAAWVAGAASLVWLGVSAVDWKLSGRCLLGLLVLYLPVRVIASFRAGSSRDETCAAAARLLLAVLALAFMARMGLNGRIRHYGFWQAALAATLVPAVLLGELPAWIRTDRAGRALILAGTLALLLPGVISLAVLTRSQLRVKTCEVGEGRDRFYAFPPELVPSGDLVQRFATNLRQRPEGDRLLVLPEGVMLNYLARMPSPVAPFFFFSFATSGGREAELVRQLQASPPEWVALISRNLEEYGIRRYGESEGHGKLLMDWVHASYVPISQIGGDPLDPAQFGGIVLHRRVLAR